MHIRHTCAYPTHLHMQLKPLAQEFTLYDMGPGSSRHAAPPGAHPLEESLLEEASTWCSTGEGCRPTGGARGRALGTWQRMHPGRASMLHAFEHPTTSPSLGGDQRPCLQFPFPLGSLFRESSLMYFSEWSLVPDPLKLLRPLYSQLISLLESPAESPFASACLPGGQEAAWKPCPRPSLGTFQALSSLALVAGPPAPVEYSALAHNRRGALCPQRGWHDNRTRIHRGLCRWGPVSFPEPCSRAWNCLRHPLLQSSGSGSWGGVRLEGRHGSR